MIPESVREAILSVTGPIRNTNPVGGGCIAHAIRVEAANGTLFLKWAEGEAGKTFEAEADGLRTLKAAADTLGLVVPEPVAAAVAGEGPGFLLMDWIEAGIAHEDDWRRFGSALAELHRLDSTIEEGGAFGYASDNWIGSKPQQNGWAKSWPEFFGTMRLLAQAETVRQRGAWNANWDASLDRLIACLPKILPEAPHPSLLHGDLWAGNVLPTSDGRFALIDPAVYIGHRETDLAMTELFGGFSPAFYEGYREAWRLDPGSSERMEIYNLFHLINHLTHGPGYAGQVEAALRNFT